MTEKIKRISEKKKYRTELYPTIIAVMIGVAVGTITNYNLFYTTPAFMLGYYLGWLYKERVEKKLEIKK